MPETGKIIKNEKVIEKILKHLELWDLEVSPPPKAKGPSITIPIDDSGFQVPSSTPPFYLDPGCPVDSYLN